MAVFLNGVRVAKLETKDQKGAGQELDLGTAALIKLVPGDDLDVYFKSNQNNTSLTINRAGLMAHRITAGANAATYSTTVTSWTADTGKYRADIVHNLDTEDVIVQGFLTADKKNVGFEDIERIDVNTVRVWVATEENIRVVVAASGGAAGGGAPAASLPSYVFQADQLLTPNNADWAVNTFAPLSADTNNNALLNRAFDDTTEEGVGCVINVPSGVTNLIPKSKSRAETAPAGARTVGLKLYVRTIPDNGAVSSWSSGYVMSDIDIPANEYWQYDEETILLSALGLSAGDTVQLQLTRVNPAAGTELVGDWNLLELGVEFS
jgi:hypothetical protein